MKILLFTGYSCAFAKFDRIYWWDWHVPSYSMYSVSFHNEHSNTHTKYRKITHWLSHIFSANAWDICASNRFHGTKYQNFVSIHANLIQYFYDTNALTMRSINTSIILKQLMNAVQDIFKTSEIFAVQTIQSDETTWKWMRIFRLLCGDSKELLFKDAAAVNSYPFLIL